MSHFNQPNRERKKCVWTTKYKRLSEMCNVQHVEMKRVFTFQPIKRLVSTTVKSAKPAAMFWIFLLRIKNYVVWRWPYTLFRRKDKSRPRKRKTNSFLKEISPPIAVTRTKKGQIESKYGKNLFVSYWLMIWATYAFFKSFYSISIYSPPVKFNHTIYTKIWSCQSPTTESSGLSILVPTLLLLQYMILIKI